MCSKNLDVLLTGASGGIGKAIAERLIKDKYNVVLCYNKNDSFIKDIEELREEHGVSARYLRFDINDRAKAKEILINDIEEHGAYYAVICNAGIHKDLPFPGMDDESWDSVINTNLNSVYNILSPIMLTLIQKRKTKRIVTISSVSGVKGNRGQTNYSASKAGIIGFTKSLAVELGKRNITVNAIAPGAIDTEMVDNKELLEEIKHVIALRRVGRAEEVAGVASFLLSDDASYITKQVIQVDGGML